MYLFKMNQNAVPNCGVVQSSERNSRCGLKFQVLLIKDMAAGHLMDQTFQVSGPKIWNMLHVFIYNIDGDDFIRFKTALDNHLMNLQDIQRVGSCKMRKNSLINILGF